MRKFASAFQRTFLGILVLLQIFFYPAVGLAQEATDATTSDTGSAASSTETSDPAPTSDPDPGPSADSTTNTSAATTGPTGPTGPTSPTGPSGPTGQSSPNGAGGGTYTYNESTGLWENAYYTWNPVTHQTAPKTPQNYSYNPNTGMWDTTQWRFDAPSGKYVANIVSVPKAPSANDPLIANTGPNSSNNIGINNNNNGTFNLFYNSNISNTVNSSAHSGDASVLQNTNGGSALTGDANGVVNLLNLLQSSWDPTLSFSANINGDVTGDLMLDPNQILNSGPSSQNGIGVNNNNNLDINVQANGRIENNVNLDVGSGDAAVSDNTHGGDATSGNATALVNLINLINSAISAKDSFLGVININGNLDGDILLPQNLVAQLDTTGPNSTNSVTQNGNTTTNETVVDNKSITNNTNLSAGTGQANITGNTNAGNASTGDASTKINIYNLTGRQIIGDNALLVFVNLKGKWTGLIFNAPSGTNTVLGTGPNSSNTINGNTNNNTDVNIGANSDIVNNVTAGANSGDATVSNNTTGGNAKTGNATASANIANLIGSSLKLDGWFGILFINVLGSWNGSFGVNTAAGNAAAAATGGSGGGGASNPVIIAFAPKSWTSAGTASNSSQSQTQVVAGTSDNKPTPPASSATKLPVVATQPKTQSDSKLIWVPVVGFIAGIGLLLLEWLISFGQRIKVVWASRD